MALAEVQIVVRHLDPSARGSSSGPGTCGAPERRRGQEGTGTAGPSSAAALAGLKADLERAMREHQWLVLLNAHVAPDMVRWGRVGSALLPMTVVCLVLSWGATRWI